MPSLRKAVRNLCHVKRWGIVRTIQTQSVAEHSYLVTVYAGKIAAILGYGGPFDVLYEAALTHDWTEEFTGYLPNPVKSAIEPVQFGKFEREHLVLRFGIRYHKYDDVIDAILKVADLHEAQLFLLSELNIGNQGVQPILYAIGDLLRARVDQLLEHFPEPRVVALRTELRKSYEDERDGIQGFADLPLDIHLKARDDHG